MNESGNSLPLIVPHTARRGQFKPVQNGRLTVTLPGEKLVGKVVGIVNDNEVVIELESIPMMAGKSHNYKKGDFIPCRRMIDDLHVECWTAVSEQELNAAAAAEMLERTRPPPEAEEAPASAAVEGVPGLENWSA